VLAALWISGDILARLLLVGKIASIVMNLAKLVKKLKREVSMSEMMCKLMLLVGPLLGAEYGSIQLVHRADRADLEMNTQERG